MLAETGRLMLMRVQAVLKARSTLLGPTSARACSSVTKAFEVTLRVIYVERATGHLEWPRFRPYRRSYEVQPAASLARISVSVSVAGMALGITRCGDRIDRYSEYQPR